MGAIISTEEQQPSDCDDIFWGRIITARKDVSNQPSPLFCSVAPPQLPAVRAIVSREED
jgi:hypothetical protein